MNYDAVDRDYALGWRGDPAEILTQEPLDRKDLIRWIAAAVPAWHADALCRGERTEVFFPPVGASTQPALEMCHRCAVRAECLHYALEHDIDHGVWGATTRNSRRAIRRNAKSSTPGGRATAGATPTTRLDPSAPADGVSGSDFTGVLNYRPGDAPDETQEVVA